MSQDPFAWPNRADAGNASVDGVAPSFPANFSPLTSGLRQQPSAPSNGWVSFDDDSGGAGFAASTPAFPAAPPTVAPASIPPQAAVFPPSPGAPTPPSLARPPAPAAPPQQAATLANLTPFSSTPHTPGPQNFSPLTSSAAKSTFPTFGSLSGALSPPATATATAAAGASFYGAAAPAEAAGVAVHRLPRPPTHVTRPSAAPAAAASAGTTTNSGSTEAAAAPAASPAVASAVPAAAAAAAPSSNPFAASANPHGATAAARSLDPFADLALKPHLPRPPPMAAARSSGAVAATAMHVPAPVPGPGVGTGAGVGGLPAAVAAAAGGPASWAPSGTLPRPVAPMAGLSPPVAASPGKAQGFIDSCPFQTFTSPAKPAGAGGVQHGTPSVPSSPLPPPSPLPPASPPPPPAYSAAVHMPTAAPRPHPPPPSYEEALSTPSKIQPPRPPPPPPHYSDALAMPQAQGLPPPPPPPPPYEEATSMPTVQALSAAASPAAGPSCWTSFDDHAGGRPADSAATATALAPPSSDAAAVVPPLLPPQAHQPPPPSQQQHDPWQPLSNGVWQTQPQPQPPPQQQPAFQPSPSFAAAAQAQPPLPSQICVEVRLPPWKPKEAAWPKRLAAGMGHAFAAPGLDGVAALQWCLHPGGPGPGSGHAAGQPEPGAEGALGPRFELPAGSGVQRAPEDWDSAPAAALVLPPGLSDSPVTCMHVDPAGGSMWTGHKDGKVVRWSVWPGRAAAYEHHWKAHIRSKVTCLALTPWGELWTGSAAGSVKVWQYLTGTPAARPPDRLLECRRARLTLGPAARSAAQRAHSKVRLLAVGPSGRVVWSAGRSGLALWGAYDGEFLGALTPGQWGAQGGGGGGAGGGGGPGAYAGETGGGFMANGGAMDSFEINPQTGLDSALVNRPFVPRAPPERCDDAEAAEVPVPAQVFKGLAGAAKFAAKLGKKIRQNFAGEAPGGGLDGGGLGGGAEAGGGPAGGSGPGKVVALVSGADGAVYVGYQRGLMEKYTEWGRLLWSRDYGRGVRLHSAALVGCLLWLGCGDGAIRTAAAASGEPGRSWKAHDFPVVGLAHDAGGAGATGGFGAAGGSGLVYSLSENGSVRAWPAAPPAEAQLVAWRDGLLPSLRRHSVAVLAATWNVNETRPAPASLRTWLTPRALGAEVVCVALQEVEMGTSSVARDAAITLLSKSMLERGNQNAQWWAAELAAALADTGQSWVRVALRQMSGLVAVVYCRAELQQHVGEVATANVACGVMGVGGNKGAVAVSMSVFRRRLMFVCSHFAAHQERVDERNDNYHKIVRTLHFDNTSKVAQLQKQQQQQLQPSAAAGSGTDDVYDPDAASAAADAPASEDDGHGPGLSDAAMLVWAGDFNYRINGSYDEVKAAAQAGDFKALFALDQCRAEMDKGTIFRGLREPLPAGHPMFVPTYKFDKGQPTRVLPAVQSATAAGGVAAVRYELPYDTSEKQRVPAWTDRIFYRGSRPGGLDVAAEEVTVGLSRPEDYGCVLEVADSDHKPVFALLQLQLPAYKQDEKRRHSLAAALSAHRAALSGAAAVAADPHAAPVQASPPHLHIRTNGVASIDLRNGSAAAFLVHVSAERPTAGAPGGRAAGAPGPLPGWLEVSPTVFALPGGGAEGRARVRVRALGGEGHRPPEPVRLHFSLRPLWGARTQAGAVGPVVTVALTH